MTQQQKIRRTPHESNGLKDRGRLFREWLLVSAFLLYEPHSRVQEHPACRRLLSGGRWSMEWIIVWIVCGSWRPRTDQGSRRQTQWWKWTGFRSRWESSSSQWTSACRPWSRSNWLFLLWSLLSYFNRSCAPPWLDLRALLELRCTCYFCRSMTWDLLANATYATILYCWFQ